MFFVINPADAIHTDSASPYINPSMGYYLLDSEVLSVEEVSGAELSERKQNGVVICNMYDTLSGLMVNSFTPFADIVRHNAVKSQVLKTDLLICLGGDFVLYSSGTFTLWDRIYELDVKCENRVVSLYLNRQIILQYKLAGRNFNLDTSHVYRTGVAYVYKMNEHLVVRYVFLLGNKNILTTMLINADGELVAILGDRNYDTIDAYVKKDVVLLSKFCMLQEAKY